MFEPRPRPASRVLLAFFVASGLGSMSASVQAQESSSGEDAGAEEDSSPSPTAPVETPADQPSAVAEPVPSDDVMLEEELELLEEQVLDEERGAPPGEPGPDDAEPKAQVKGDDAMPELREVTVRYTPEDIFRMGGSVQALDQEQLQKLQYDDPNTVLLQVPGVYIRQEDGFGLRPNIGLRGTNPNRSAKVTLMEDGVLFGPAPYSAPAAYYFPMMARMSGVEVFKGPAAILYGPQTVAGAINYVSRPVPEEPRGQIDVSYGRFQTFRGHLHYGRHNGWGGFLVEGIHLGTQGFKEVDGGYGRGDTGFQRSEFMFKGYVNNELASHAFNRLTVKFIGSRESSNETYLGLTDADFRAHPYRRYAASQLDNMNWWRTAVDLSHNLAVGEHIRLETTAYRHDFDRTWERLNQFRDGTQLIDVVTQPTTPPLDSYYAVLTGQQNSPSVDGGTDGQDLMVISNHRRFVVMGIQTRLRADFDTDKVHHEIESGLRFHYDSVDRFQPEQGYRMENLQLVWDGLTYQQNPALLIDDNKAEAQALAGYLMYGIEVAGLVIKPGVRVEYIRTFFEDEKDQPELGRVAEDPQLVFLPGIGLQYTILQGFAALAGVHRGFSAVTPGNRPFADPELSMNYEAGFRYATQDSRGFGELIGFFNDYSNITSECTLSAGCNPALVDRQFNNGRAFIGGIEALGGYDVSLPRELTMPVRVSYTYTNATYRTTFESSDPTIGDVMKGDPIPYVPAHMLNAQVGFNKSFWAAYVIGNYFGKMPEGAVGLQPLPDTDGYFVLDVVGRIRFEPVEAYVRLQNLTSTEAIVARRPFGARPNAPLTFQIGAQVTF
jgi:Fe(3+) dicitrate transport protein